MEMPDACTKINVGHGLLGAKVGLDASPHLWKTAR